MNEYEPPIERYSLRVRTPLYLRILRHPFIRLFLGTILLFLSFVIPQVAVALAYFALTGDQDFAKNQTVMLIAECCQLVVLPIYIAFVLMVEGRRVSELAPRPAIVDFVKGAMISCALISTVIGILLLLGAYEIAGYSSADAMLFPLGMAIGSGISEEIIARGLWFRVMEEWLGSAIGLAFSAFLFGFIHILNPGATVYSSVAITLEAGLILGAAYMLTRRLWMSIGMHMAWNFTLGGIFGAGVSGQDWKGLIQLKQTGSDLLTGGDFGPEASIVCLIVCTIGGICVLALAIRRGQWVELFGRKATAPASEAPSDGVSPSTLGAITADPASQPSSTKYQPESPPDSPTQNRPDPIDEL
jgi:hypothetical protein